MTREEYISEAMRAEADWLEDILAGLLINGIHKEEIEICRYQNDPLHITVKVKGTVKYQYRTILKGE